MITCKKNRSKLVFTREDGKTAIYDLADQSCYNYQGRQVKSLNSFFANYSTYDIEWQNVAYKKFVLTVSSSNRRLRNIGSMLTQLHHFRHNEGYLLLGLPVSGRMDKPVSDLPKVVRKYLVSRFANNGDGTGYSNNGYYYRQWFNYLSDEGELKMRILSMIDQLDLSDIFDTLEINNMRYLSDLVSSYNMDIKSLLLQVSHYIQREGLSIHETLRNLTDYNSMSSKMTSKYQKYPKYLLSTHHIVVRNYNAFRTYYEEQSFLNAVDKSLYHKGTTYSVLVPEKSQDIKDEGASQHHCVASYVSSVISGKTQIVFLRHNKALDKSLITMEIKNGSVYQAKGSYNRSVSEDELKFIRTYANQHNLTVSNHL